MTMVFMTITSSVLFHLSVNLIDIGMSFKQTAIFIHSAKEGTCCTKLGVANEFKVATYAHLQCALNFHLFDIVISLQ